MYKEDVIAPNVEIPISEVMLDSVLRVILFNAMRKAYDEHKHSTCNCADAIECEESECDKDYYRGHSDYCYAFQGQQEEAWKAETNSDHTKWPEFVIYPGNCLHSTGQCDRKFEPHKIDRISPESVIPGQFIKFAEPKSHWNCVYWVRFQYGPHGYLADYGIDADGIAHCWAD